MFMTISKAENMLQELTHFLQRQMINSKGEYAITLEQIKIQGKYNSYDYSF